MSSVPHVDLDAEIRAAIRESLGEPDDADLVEQSEEVPDEELQPPLHNPLWAGGSHGGMI